ncbi:MAG: DUF502 domain-containing protein, partial [Methylococcales bacterium]
MSYLYRLFIKGILTVLPVTLTFYLVYWIISSIENLLNRYVVALIPNFLQFPGMGILTAIGLFIGVGFLMSHFVSDRFSGLFEGWLTKIPIVKTVYGPLKDLLHLFAKKPDQSMQRVVLV